MSDQIQRHPLIGVTVNVKAVGDCPSFTGVIRSAWLHTEPRKPTVTYFHVEDTGGRLWHRSLREFETTSAVQAAA